MKKKLMILLPVLLAALGGTYKFALAKPAPVPKPKVDGEVYVLPKDFMINLDGGQFGKLGVALVLGHGAAAAGGGGHGAAPVKPPDGYGVLPQEAIVRAIVTDVLTGEKPEHLKAKKARKELQHEILERLEKTTDVHAKDVLFTDVAVQ